MAAGGKAAPDPIYPSDVFKAHTYKGKSSSNNVITQVDMTGENDGLVWIKSAEGNNRPHFLYDTKRGGSKRLETSNNGQEETVGSGYAINFQGFGFNIPSNWSGENSTADHYCSWNFKCQPGFFDIVQWTGDGNVTGRQIAHNLDAEIGMILVKRVDAGGNWYMWHKDVASNEGNDYYFLVNDNNYARNVEDIWSSPGSTFSSTHFTVGADINGTTDKYIAYIWAHDDTRFGPDQTDSIVKVGTYTGTGGANGVQVNLGWKPQYVWIKANAQGSSYSHMLFDNTRGMEYAQGATFPLRANSEDRHGQTYTPASAWITTNENGFIADPAGWGNFSVGESGKQYYYIAIREDFKPKDYNIEYLHITNFSGDGQYQRELQIGFDYDLMWFKNRTSNEKFAVYDRYRGYKPLALNSPGSQTNTIWEMWRNWSYPYLGDHSSTNPSNAAQVMFYGFREDPDFLQIQTWKGTGADYGIKHGLNGAPNFTIVKGIDSGNDWQILVDTPSTAKHWNGFDNGVAESGISHAHWSPYAADAVWSYVGNSNDTNGSGNHYVGYFFKNKPGVLVSGFYTEYSTNKTIPCGFAPRLVIVKRVDNDYNGWTLWDSTRGSNVAFTMGSTSAESSHGGLTLTSNGFVANAGYAATNIGDGSNTQYWFAAFA